MTSQHTPTRIRRASAALAVGLLALGATACGDDSEDSADTAAPTVAETAAPATDTPVDGVVLIDGAWARTSPMDAANGAAYVTITSPIDDKLVGAMVDTSVAEMTEIHETVMVESSDTTMAGGMGSDTTMAGGMGSDTTMAGMGEMTMQPVEYIELKAGEPMMMKPGGYHIMLMKLAAPLEVGQTIELTLTFEKAGDVKVDVPVLDEAP